MAVDLWSTGVDVRLMLPGAIDTEIWDQPDNESALYDGPLEPPEVVAEGIIAAIEGDTFEHYLPDLKPVVEFKTGDIDTFMVGLADMAGRPRRRPDDEGARVPHRPRCRAGRRLPTRRELRAEPQRHTDGPRGGARPALLGPTTGSCCAPRLTGICGSDTKQVLMDFEDADDNPMTAFISFPQVLGHEVVADRRAGRPEVDDLEVGQRVVLNPWLSCGPRGIDPVCPPCEVGDFSQCWHFLDGRLSPGIHTGNSTEATGGFADLLPAHRSMVFPVPDDVTDEVAVLADPFSVALHAITRNPPPPGAGRWCTAPARSAPPPPPSSAPSTPASGWPPSPAGRPRPIWPAGSGPRCSLPNRALQLVEAAGRRGPRRRCARPWAGLPVAYPGHIDVVYDTIGSPRTIEVAIRVLAAAGTLVQLGVSSPGRFEWTPWYFKELRLVGSNAFGVEEVEGVRKHAIEHYLDLVRAGRIDLSGMLTHRFRLDQWRDAFGTLDRPGRQRRHQGGVRLPLNPTRGRSRRISRPRRDATASSSRTRRPPLVLDAVAA